MYDWPAGQAPTWWWRRDAELARLGAARCATVGELWGRFRINAVSPTVLSESREKYAAPMPGFPAVDAADVGQAYVWSVESMETGRIYEV